MNELVRFFFVIFTWLVGRQLLTSKMKKLDKEWMRAWRVGLQAFFFKLRNDNHIIIKEAILKFIICATSAVCSVERNMNFSIDRYVKNVSSEKNEDKSFKSDLLSVHYTQYSL